MSAQKSQWETTSVAETEQVAQKILEEILLNKKIVLLKGQLGSGKTTFTKGIAKALGINEPITSPTYTYVNTYQIPKHPNNHHHLKLLVHFDLYRLPDHIPDTETTKAEIGLDKAINDPHSLVMIEWPERLGLSEGIIIEFEKKAEKHEVRVISS